MLDISGNFSGDACNKQESAFDEGGESINRVFLLVKIGGFMKGVLFFVVAILLMVNVVNAQECRPDQVYTEIVKDDRENSQVMLSHTIAQLEEQKAENEKLKVEIEALKKEEKKDEKTDK